MKTFIIAAIAICYSFTAKAQNYEMFKRKPWEEYKLRHLLRDSLKNILPMPQLKKMDTGKEISGVAKVDLKGTFTGENGKGDEIYAMGTDRMPCLVAGKKVTLNMPVAGIEKNEKVNLPLLLKKYETQIK